MMGNAALYTIIIIALAVLSVMFVSYLKREVFVTGTKAAAITTRGILLRFCLPRGFKVLSDVKLKDGSKEIIIENMMIGYFGVLLVRTLGVRGEYYGALDAENWSLLSKGKASTDKKDTIKNPLKLLECEESALRAAFSKNKIYNIPVEKIIYISNKSSKTAVYVTHNGEILLGGKLSGYLQKSKFEKDAGLDVKKIADIITGAHI